MLKLRPELAKLSLPENGHTACTTVFSHSPGMVRLLLENGADPKGIWPHRDATPPFILAKDRGYEDIAQVFLEDESVEIQPPEEFLAVVHDESATLAFLEGHTEYIRVPFYRMALLYTAAARLWPQLLNWLLDPIQHRRREIVDLLLDLGFDSNERHRSSAEEVRYSWGAPLSACVKQNDFEIARLLLDRGADPDGQDSYYGTAVYTAYCDKNAQMIELLESGGGPQRRRSRLRGPNRDRPKNARRRNGSPFRRGPIRRQNHQMRPGPKTSALAIMPASARSWTAPAPAPTFTRGTRVRPFSTK